MQTLYYLLAGLAGGVPAGMGLGGGTLLIPILTIFLDTPQQSAQAVNLLAFIPAACIALVIHSKNRLVDFKLALRLTLPALATAVPAAMFAQRLQAQNLRLAFGIFLVAFGIFPIIRQIYRGIISAYGTKNRYNLR